MKKIPMLIIGILILSGFGAVAIDGNIGDSKAIKEKNTDTSTTEAETHTILAELLTATWCGYCKYAHAALKQYYEEGSYPLLYVSFVNDKNKNANDRMSEYNNVYYPNVFFDGGYYVITGGSDNIFKIYKRLIRDFIAKREVADIDIEINAKQSGDAAFHLEISVINNEETQYDGRIRVYITEIVSEMGWIDTGRQNYTFAFLDYAWNEDINISGNDTWTKSMVWDGNNFNDGYGNNFSSIRCDNIMIIVGVFNAEWHQGYSYGFQYPFDAYYLDDAASSTVIENNKPNTPTIEGATNGGIGVEYSYSFLSTDPEGDDISYYVDWGDGSTSGWIGPSGSGIEVTEAHVWTTQGTYTIQAKAKDSIGLESNWATLEVAMPKNQPYNTPFLNFLDQHPRLFPILRHLMGL